MKEKNIFNIKSRNENYQIFDTFRFFMNWKRFLLEQQYLLSFIFTGVWHL